MLSPRYRRQAPRGEVLKSWRSEVRNYSECHSLHKARFCFIETLWISMALFNLLRRTIIAACGTPSRAPPEASAIVFVPRHFLFTPITAVAARRYRGRQQM